MLTLSDKHFHLNYRYARMPLVPTSLLPVNFSPYGMMRDGIPEWSVVVQTNSRHRAEGSVAFPAEVTTTVRQSLLGKEERERVELAVQ